MRADEGMWLFNDLPLKRLADKYSFEPEPEWADHVRLSSVRFNSGGSASFVSSTGLVLTNHHVGSDMLQKISTPEKNYLRDGFYASTLADEVPAPDLELNQLVAIEDVTERVKAAVKPDLSPADAFAARRAVIAQIEKESFDRTGLRSDVVTLYGGGKYQLYRYKKYTDVRLAFAPETATAFFGGDPDNFEYPRYCLDICLFRVYEDGQPAKIENFLKYSPSGAADGELVFVSGNPGRTDRQDTAAALVHHRDVRMPFMLNWLRRQEVLLQQYGYGGEEQTRRARDELFSIQNSRKAYMGMLGGLQDPAFMVAKRQSEDSLLVKVAADESLRKFAGAWEQVRLAQLARARLLVRYEMLERGRGFRTELFGIARTLVRMAEEDQKPDTERLDEYRGSARESLEQQLFSPAPIYPDLEQVKLADSLGLLAEQLGGDNPLVVRTFADKSPGERAAQLVQETRLADIEFRRELAKGGKAAIEACTDPLVQLAREVDPAARSVRKEFEEQVEEVERQAYAQITEAIFATEGASTYPDATFTLRLSYGQVKGYEENGQQIAPWTTLGGAFEHEKAHGGRDPWELPKRWHERKDSLDLSTPLNFVCTADIIGGNSGSPVINRQGEFVGIIFDGNIQSLTSDFMYSDQQGRAVSVHSSAIREALSKIYDAGRLADELGK